MTFRAPLLWLLPCFPCAGCVLLPPGTSSGDVAANEPRPVLVLSPAPGEGEGVDERGRQAAWEGLTRDADLQHLGLDVHLDLEAGRLYGTATNTFKMLREGTRSLRLHAQEVDIREILDSDGRALGFRREGTTLEVDLEEVLAVGDEVAIEVRFKAEPSSHYLSTIEDRGAFVPEAFASGQDGGLRRWIPTWDAPGDLTKIDVIARVRDDMYVVSNGVLVAVDDVDRAGRGERTFTWQQSVPVSVRSLTLAAARFESFAAKSGDIDVYFHLPQGTTEDTAQRTFGESPAVLAYFQNRLAQPFPFPRYDQVILRSLPEQLVDGASMTLIAASELASETDELDDRREMPRRTVARGVARKWFGAWISALDERHRWLLDGVAYQLELDYEAHVRGETEVALEWEEVRQQIVRRAQAMESEGGASGDMGQDATGTDRRFEDSERAGWTLRTLRVRLGEATFWALLRKLAAGAAGRVITVEDFRRAALRETGFDLGPDLAQWGQRRTVPELKVRFQRRSVTGVGDSLGILVEQVQPGPLFRIELPIVVHFEDGTYSRRRMVIDTRKDLLIEPLNQRVIDVGIDPEGVVLGGFDIEKDDASWVAQARLSRSSVERMRAVPELERIATAVPAEVSADDPSAVPEPIEAARQALIRLLLASPEPTLRERCAAALQFPGPAAIGALRRAAGEDPSPWVRRAAFHGLLQAYAGGRWEPGPEDIPELLTLRHREVSPAVVAEIEELLATIPTR